MRAVTVRGAGFAFGLAVAAVVSVAPRSAAQEAAKQALPPPQEAFAQVRALAGEGKYELAAVFLQAFVDSNPKDEDFLELERRYGNTVFRQLRTIPRWSDDPKTDAKARENVEAIVKRSAEITAKLLQNPARVNKFIRNLGESPEERDFAEVELKRTGDYAMPLLVDAFRRNVSPAITTGILGLIPKLDLSTTAGWVAALDGLSPDQQYAVLSRLLARTDTPAQLETAQGDFVPYLWRLAAQADAPASLRQYARDQLGKLVRGADRIQPEAALVAAARPFADRKGRYAGATGNAAANPDGTPTTVVVWVWNAAEEKLVKQEAVPTGQADEYYALRYARWALELRPDYEPAQAVVLTVAADWAMERGKYGDLARTDPTVYRLLADAPPVVLTDLLGRALFEKRTGVVLALTQVIGDRADRSATASVPGKPSLFERALDYPDPRVQLAAANALLRAPTPVDPKLRGRVIEVLKRAAAADPGVPGAAKGQALIADPNRLRADDTAAMLRAIGYDTQIYASGRDLLRRVARASDFDLLVIDRHVVNPELRDVIGHLKADANAARRPVLVVASADKAIPPSLDQLLLRMALLIAATETELVGMEAPYVPKLGQTAEQIEAERGTVQARRDGVFRSTVTDRMARLQRVLDTAGLEFTRDQKFQLGLKLEQITYAVLAAEYPLTPTSAPATFQHVTALQKQIQAQPSIPEYKRQVGVDHLMKMIERLELDVSQAKPAQARFDALRARVDPEALGLVVQPPRDYAAEAQAARIVRGYPFVRVIPEPYSRVWFEADVNAAFADPADRPRDPAEKKAAASLAVGWLAKMATGEVTGFDAKPAAGVLLDALRTDDLADPAIGAVAHFATAGAQQALVNLALSGTRPLPLRTRAADAAIRHVQTHGKLTPDSLITAIVAQAASEPDADLRGKFLVLKALLAPNAKEYTAGLRNYAPPLVPAVVVPKGDGAPPPADKIDPKPNN